MKMLRNDVGGDCGSGGRTVVVGVKMDSRSRELLTWALVKVAEPHDSVIALHVLGKNEIVDRDGKSSLLSLVKALDSVLHVYEGFCNLKQVDLKLKICRGSSIRKVLVREAISYHATKIIVGTAQNHHTIRSSTSVAKYCAKKLSKDCCILAVNNGKVVFQREGSPATTSVCAGIEEHRPNGLFSVMIHKNSKALSDSDATAQSLTSYQGSHRTLEEVLVQTSAGCVESEPKQKCSICAPATELGGNFSGQSVDDEPNSDCEDRSLALVPVKVASTSVSTLIRELPELRPGWPLLCRDIRSNQETSSKSSGKQMSVVQWAMRLPTRQYPSLACMSNNKEDTGELGDQASNLDGESGAIVAVGTENEAAPLYPDQESGTLPKELRDLHEKFSSTCRLFQYQELASATSNFLTENLVGKGGNSKVYRGCLRDGKELAVKILKQSDDALKEFVLEIEIITTLHHKNIISLLGFCYEDNNLLLVYDFLSRGSLEENLHGNKKDTLSFGWIERYKVALGVAEALEYLHSRGDQRVIHRDVKSSNILLSDDFEPQLSDFGLAKWASTSSHITCTDVAGTFGYLAPEYFMYGKVNDKIDVYAFGVVLLELLSGRKPISSEYPKGQESIVMWAKPILHRWKITQLLDPSLGDNYDHAIIERLVMAATLCIRRSPRARPQMSIVSKLLHGDTNVIQWAKLELNGFEESNMVDDELCLGTNIQSHLNLALLDVEDDSTSLSSIEQNISLEDYLQGRWSQSSSFDQHYLRQTAS